MPRLCPVLLLTLWTAACASSASSPGPSPAGLPAAVIETSTGAVIRLGEGEVAAEATLDAPPERVWAVLPEIYHELGIPVEISDPSAQTYGTQKLAQSRIGGKRTADFVRCGHEGSGVSAMSAHRYRLSVVSSLRPAGNGRTALATQVGGFATPLEGTSTGAVRCASTGVLEQRIQALVAERLRG